MPKDFYSVQVQSIQYCEAVQLQDFITFGFAADFVQQEIVMSKRLMTVVASYTRRKINM